MTDGERKKLTFQGFLMDLEEGGEKDSEGVFTVAARQTVSKLRTQFEDDTVLGFTEILQGFQELGAERVEIANRSRRDVTISARFGTDAPDLSGWLSDPFALLSAENCLHSGTGLLLLQHEQSTVVWTLLDHRTRSDWRFRSKSGVFEPTNEASKSQCDPSTHRIGSVWLQLHILASRPLSIFTTNALWKTARLNREFTNRLAFYGRPLYYRGQSIQCPLPGRLVPHDRWTRSPTGGMGYSWVPLAYQYVAASPSSSHCFLSEPFTGIIARKVSVGGATLTGYQSTQKPDYVSLKGCSNQESAPTVPFKRTWWLPAEKLAVSGFQAFPQKLKNPRLEPPLFRSHPRGYPLLCDRVLMLSTALSGNSTLVFIKHGVVLGARHEELEVPGSLCLVGLERLSTDLGRRKVRQDEEYTKLVAEVRRQMSCFYQEASHILGF